MDEFDYVIVGCGSAGCVLANRLSADPDVTVCVLEAGGKDWHPYIHLPAGFIKTYSMPSVNWLYEMEPSDGTAGRKIAAPRGKTLGGSSSINGHIYNRGQAADYDHWAQRGNRGWGYRDVLPYFKRLERRDGGDDTYRGRSGNLVVTDPNWRHPLCDAFIEGCVQEGIPHNPDYNGASQLGVSYSQRTIKDGRRMSAARAFLHPVMYRRNLEVRTRAHVTGLMLDGKRATGVRYARGGRMGSRHEVKARREVILSGGTYNSPQVLELSGIGDPEHLRAVGIEVVHALPGVGANLRDHYAPRFAARVKGIDTINQRVRGLGLVKEAANWAINRSGVLSAAPTMVYCFWKSEPHLESGDVQLTFTPASYAEGVQGKLEDTPGMTCAPWQQRPESHGFSRIRSADPFEAPAIDPRYLSAEEDRQVVVKAMKLARRLLQTAPLKPFYDGESYPGDTFQTDEELLEVARERGTTTFHPAGTCRMGPATDPSTVVDDTLKVHGTEGLRVVDASVMPMMLSANLNAGTMMIADKASDMIRGVAPPEAAELRQPAEA
ncbi:MAG: GMC family oxidoreductase N-terminal domain-containing protein [Pseudomonadota bacterium]